MQKAIYEIAIRAYKALIRLASFRNEKAKKWIEGRENWRELLASKIDPNKPRILVHAASLGEMEQGLPVLKKLREAKPEHQIILSFYSPSGYEHFKESKLYDLLIYLPEDSSKNATDFASIVQAQLALFIKYEIWPNLLASLKAEDCKLVLAPAVFRPQQVYFKAPKYNWLTKSLHNFDHILVQDEASMALLSPLKLKQLSICGDS
ncbi:MAG: 3-deoxy-D-manno-octulosonic acid transferase, partial [Croceimicrobium sp.]